jgi:hypothetical protein
MPHRMIKRVFIILPTLLLAFGVLFISILRTASVRYEFSGVVNGAEAASSVLGADSINVKYTLAYPGRILPDHPLWPVKALRDRVWLLVTTNPSRKAELKLLFADKRIGMSKILFEKEKYGVAFSTLTKAEKYLEEACIEENINRDKGFDTAEFLKVLSVSSLKHRQVIEEILLIAPEDAKPKIIDTVWYSKSVYEKTMHALNEKGLDVPENPFDRE